MNLREKVLVLNRVWQALRVVDVEQALTDMCRGAMTAIDTETMTPVKWDQWIQLTVTEGDKCIQTVRGPIRVPVVICASTYAGMPKKVPKLSRKGIATRDKRVCQYTGEYAPNGTIDHVIPTSRKGAKKSWENLVWCKREINARKGNRLNEEAGLKLIRQPKAPKPVSASLLIEEHRPEWVPFLGKAA
jgi:5-methylcytosine-specific restriction endonuclease McrA